MTTFVAPTIPGELQWTHEPLDWKVGPGNRLTITAGENTDWFIDPAGNTIKDNAPSALFAPPDASFVLSARVTVKFALAFDAGGIQLRAREDLWAKLCLGKLDALRVGFSAQSPTGQKCTAVFSEINYRAGVLKDIRSGD